jgi:hypothetical protein
MKIKSEAQDAKAGRDQRKQPAQKAGEAKP